MENTIELPITNIEGTAFLIDVVNREFRQVDNEDNRLKIVDMEDRVSHYEFDYDRSTKSIATLFSDQADVATIKVLQLSTLYPEGMAMAYNKDIEEVKTKSDFEIILDQEALQNRLLGQLPTIDIEGHLFYVDMMMDYLRPKDDFFALGIPFAMVEGYTTAEGESCIASYNPETHSCEPLDYYTITAIPKNLIAIEFPSMQQLDPVGYARRFRLDMKECLRQTPIKSHFTAKKVEWSATRVPEIIERNKQKLIGKIKVVGENVSAQRRRKGKRL